VVTVPRTEATRPASGAGVSSFADAKKGLHKQKARMKNCGNRNHTDRRRHLLFVGELIAGERPAT
jgi:hypothetical protein